MLISSLFSISANANQCLPKDKVSAISGIQGVGDSSPFTGKTVIVQGRITANMQKRSKLKGIYISDNQQQADLTSGTSDGIFIYLPEGHASIPKNLALKAGQSIQVQGRVKEYYGLTELTHIQNIILCSADLKIPIAAKIFSLDNESLESREGMLVQLKDSWVSGNKDFSRYGELQLSTKSPLLSRRLNEPENLVLSLGEKPSRQSLFSNPAHARLGTKLKPITGVVHFAYGKYWLIPTQPLQVETLSRPPIPETPNFSRISITHLNLKNLFNGDGHGQQFPTKRGAKTYRDYQIQLNKIAIGLNELNTKIIAVSELENDGYGTHSAIDDLVKAINSHRNSNPYIYARLAHEDGNQSTDAITQGFLYQSDSISVNDVTFLSLQSSHQPARPALLVNGVFRSDQQRFQMAIVHFKSRGRPCSEDSTMPQTSRSFEGNCSQRREQEMNKLLDQIKPTEGIDLIVGDFNAYPNERPLQSAEQKGWIRTRDLEYNINGHSGNIDYTYVYDNQLIILDHILLHQDDQPSFLKRLDWHINAAESSEILKHENETGVASRYRSSDHDPNILYLK